METVWVSKYALSGGVAEYQAEIRDGKAYPVKPFMLFSVNDPQSVVMIGVPDNNISMLTPAKGSRYSEGQNAARALAISSLRCALSADPTNLTCGGNVLPSGH